MGKISVNNELKMKEEWDSGFQFTNTETEGNKEKFQKGKSLLFRRNRKGNHLLLFRKKAQDGQ